MKKTSPPHRLRCPECRTRRTDPHAMVLHRLHCTRPLCHCMRVPFPHRPGGFLFCEQHPLSDIAWAKVHGATDEQLDEIALEIIWRAPAKASNAACPF